MALGSVLQLLAYIRMRSLALLVPSWRRHVRALARARALGDYLLVGVWGDDGGDGNSAAQTNRNRNVMSLGERALSVLSCRHVDDVVLAPPRGAPPDAATLAALNVRVLANVTNMAPDFEPLSGGGAGGEIDSGVEVREVDMGDNDFVTATIVERVRAINAAKAAAGH